MKKLVLFTAMIFTLVLTAGWTSDAPAQETGAELSLNPAPEQGAGEPFDLGEIVITAERTATLLKDTAATVTVLDRKDIEKTGALKLGDALRVAVGVNIIQHGSLGSMISAHVRGANSTQVLILLDGRPMNSPSTGMADLSQIPADRIERIEIMRTPAASLYGANAVGGVIQIFTREPSSVRNISWNVSTGGFKEKTTGLRIESPSAFGAFSIGANVQSAGGARGNSAHHATDGDASFIINSNNDRKIKLKLATHNDRNGLPGPMPALDPASRTDTQLVYGDNQISSRLDYQKTRNSSFQADADLFRNRNRALSVKLYRDMNKLDFFQEYLTFNFGDFTNHVTRLQAKYSTDNFGGDVQYEKNAGRHKLVTGFNYRHERFATISSLSDVTAGSQSLQNWKNSAANRALFVEDEMTAGRNWVLSIGTRWDSHGIYGNQLSPHFSALRHGRINTRLSVTRAFRAPSMNDLFWPEDSFSRGNTGLSPEKAMFYELGFELPIKNKTNVNINFFSRRTRDMIAWAPTGPDAGFGPKWQPSNLNTMRTNGAELQINARLSKSMGLSTSDTFLHSKQDTMDVIDGLTNAMAPASRDAIFTPRHDLKWSLNFNKARLSMSLDGRYVSKTFNYYSNWNAFPAVTMDTKSLPAHSVLNYNLTWRLNGGNEVRISIANLLDKTYYERFGNVTADRDYPMPGRNITVWFKTSSKIGE